MDRNDHGSSLQRSTSPNGIINLPESTKSNSGPVLSSSKKLSCRVIVPVRVSPKYSVASTSPPIGWPVERANAWLLENKRLGLRYDRLGFIVEALLQAACIFLVAPRLAREF
jgi:hypothetical protein